MKKVGICTVYTGYNYGSALQAFATKNILKLLGYNGEILKLSGSVIKGRDIRLGKMLVLGFNMLRRPSMAKHMISSYTANKTLSEKSKIMFDSFYQNEISPSNMAKAQLKKIAKKQDFTAFICGSDQIWNSTTFYVDSFYYLTFAPKEKRIAFAPSFGRDFIPDYNLKTISKKIKNIPHLSVREDSGQKLIENIVGTNVDVLIDPTLMLDKNEWTKILELKQQSSNDAYVLAYFLDEPSDKAKNIIKQLAERGYKIFYLPYKTDSDLYDACLEAGPKEFLQYLLNADVVCTDSFHGTAFSVNFEKEFYCFEREYKNAANQSSRVVSLLNKINLFECYDCDQVRSDENQIDFKYSKSVLAKERERSISYLLGALNKIKLQNVSEKNGKQKRD